MSKYNLIIPCQDELSLDALGLLGTMLNNPEDDYCTDEELQIAIPANSLLTIRNALKELISKEYVLQVGGNLYAVNKFNIPNMKVI